MIAMNTCHERDTFYYTILQQSVREIYWNNRDQLKRLCFAVQILHRTLPLSGSVIS